MKGGVGEEIVIPPPLVRDSSAARFDRRPAPNVRGGLEAKEPAEAHTPPIWIPRG